AAGPALAYGQGRWPGAAGTPRAPRPGWEFLHPHPPHRARPGGNGNSPAPGVEMIRPAPLVHDDGLDEADMRRHLATVNSRWDNEASVLLGDYLFTHAFYLAGTPHSVIGCGLFGRGTNL